MANNKRTAPGDRNELILVDWSMGSVVEKIEGAAYQIAKYFYHANELKAARKGSRKAAPRSGGGKLLACGLKLLKGAAKVAETGVDIPQGGIAIVRFNFNFNFNFQQRRSSTQKKKELRRRRRQRRTKDKAKRKEKEKKKAKMDKDKDKAKRKEKKDKDKAKRKEKKDKDKAKRKEKAKMDKDKAKRR